MPIPTAPHWRFTLTRLQREWARMVVDQRLRPRVDAWQLPGMAPGASLDDVLLAAGHRPATGLPLTDHPVTEPPVTVLPVPELPVTEPSVIEPSVTDPPVTDPAVAGPAGGEDERVPGDRVLAALAALAGDDELAARVVLQRLLPGLSAVARRRARCLDDHLVLTDELVASAWTVIRARPGRRRRDFVASSFLRAIEHQVFVRHERRRLVHELVEPATMDVAVEHDETGGDALFQIVGVLGAVGRRSLRAGDTELINALLRCDDLRDAARQLHVSERTVRYHRDAMVGRLRRALAA